jgi:hypothetical protein
MSDSEANDPPRPFDGMIGRLDRLLSEFLAAARGELDEADRQTIKHHADDLIGVGNAALKAIAPAPAWRPVRRLRACVDNWPECESSMYDPRCCRFPKSCSCTGYDPARVVESDLEPA